MVLESINHLARHTSITSLKDGLPPCCSSPKGTSDRVSPVGLLRIMDFGRTGLPQPSLDGFRVRDAGLPAEVVQLVFLSSESANQKGLT